MDFNTIPSFTNPLPQIIPTQIATPVQNVPPDVPPQSGEGDESENSEKKKNHRRSKNDTDGRTYICKICGKSYLSYPALYTHGRQKHGTSSTSGRGRGRPKKDTVEVDVERQKYNPLDITYFLKENRKGSTNDFNGVVDKAFELIYGNESNKEDRDKKVLRNLKRNMKDYTKIEDHPFLSKYKNDVHDVNLIISNENECTDNVLISYLNKVSIQVNPEYFMRLIQFVTLFREYLNIRYKNEDEKEFTAVTNAENVPDTSNEFINEFLDPDNGNDFDYPKEEIIDLTMNLCQWMYDNNFTCSKLTLLTNK